MQNDAYQPPSAQLGPPPKKQDWLRRFLLLNATLTLGLIGLATAAWFVLNRLGLELIGIEAQSSTDIALLVCLIWGVPNLGLAIMWGRARFRQA